MFALSVLVGISYYFGKPFQRKSHNTGRDQKHHLAHAQQLAGSDKKISLLQASASLDHLRMCLSAGLSVARALSIVAELESTHPAIEQWASDMRADPIQACRSVQANQPSLATAAHLLERSFITGAPLHAALGTLSEQMRNEASSYITQRVRSVAVKSVLPLGLCFLPAFVLIGVVPIAVGLFSHLAW